MRKLSVLIALALCLTIGGAYAAWSFATDNVTDATVTNIGIGMEVEETGSKGTLAATFTGYSYEVVPGVGNVPTLQNNATDANLVITFTTNANAEESVKANGIAVEVSIDVTDGDPFTGTAHEIEKTNVLGAKTTNGITINAGTGTGAWDNRTENLDGTVTFTKTITSNTVMSWIEIKNNAPLTDVKNAEAFETAVKAGSFTITVTSNVGG